MTFAFKTVPHIHFETGSASKLGEIAAARMTRPVIVTDKGVVGAGLIEGALASLKAKKLDYLLFDAVEADPPARVVKGAVEAARGHKADGVIGFGGGSSMDTAKIIAVLMNSAQTLEEIYGMDMVKGARAPL
ncbi:MAG: iron-containing alcohol dehydrogenase, partial [Amphiplicatus sp.]